MIAIILASGRGTRLQPLTNKRPKPLVKVDNIPLLGIQLDALQQHGITKIIITTGPFPNQIHSFADEYTELDIKFVHNQMYAKTNYILSLWLAGQALKKLNINEDIVLLHGDLAFEETVLDRLLAADVDNGVIVNQNTDPSPKDFCVSLVGNCISRIDTHLEGENVHQLYPIYKLSREAFESWLIAMGELIKQGGDGEYAEAALNKLLPKIIIRPVLISEFCAEVDNHEDLQVVKKWWHE